MKKLLICIFMVTILLVGCKKEEEGEKLTPPTQKVTLLKDLDEYKDLNINDVVSLEVIRYTEGGDQRQTTTTIEEINRTYYGLSNTKIGEETKRSCEDNTTVYVFKTKDGKKYSMEFECQWLVLGNKRYSIVK